jgi:hypothetical protein
MKKKMTLLLLMVLPAMVAQAFETGNLNEQIDSLTVQ